MNQMNYFQVLQGVAQAGLSRQEMHEGDFRDSEGLLHCGRCGEPRQHYQYLPDPTADEPDRKKKTLVAVLCRCEREEESREKQREQKKKDGELIRQLRASSMMDRKFENCRFSTCQVTDYNRRSLRQCSMYADEFEKNLRNNRGLLLWGNFGTGKSYAAACIANHLLDRKISVVMTSLVRLISEMEADRNQAERMLERINRAKLIILDDLGAERGTDAAIEKVYNIIDRRYSKDMPMILTTNLTVQEMREEPDRRYRRIYDRVFEVCAPVQFSGPDWRMKIASDSWDEWSRRMDMAEGDAAVGS